MVMAITIYGITWLSFWNQELATCKMYILFSNSFLKLYCALAFNLANCSL